MPKQIKFTLLFVVIVLLILPIPAQAKRLHTEKFYQNNWCLTQNGETEVILPDRTRVDCLTQTHAIEFDFGDKWAEAIGQALYYSIQTGKKPGVVLILEEKSNYRFWIRLNTVIDHFALPIEAWKIGEGAK